MEEPTYHLAGVMHTRDELPADFDGPLSVILLLLSKNKIEIQDVSITSILEQYLAYLDEMKRLDMEIASEFIAMRPTSCSSKRRCCSPPPSARRP